MEVCLSAKEGVDVPGVLTEILEKGVYKEDYEYITSYFQNRPVSYDTAVTAIEKICEGNLFK